MEGTESGERRASGTGQVPAGQAGRARTLDLEAGLPFALRQFLRLSRQAVPTMTVPRRPGGKGAG